MSLRGLCDFQDEPIRLEVDYINTLQCVLDVSFLEGNIKYLSEEDWINVKALLNSFLELCDVYQVSRVFMRVEDGKVNFGIMIRFEDVPELHYITVDLT